MNFVDKGIMLIVCIVEIYLLWDFFNAYFESRERWKSIEIILISMTSGLVLFLFNIMGNSYLNLIGVPVILWCYISIIFKSKIGERIIYFLTAFSILLGCEFLYVVLFNVTAEDIRGGEYVLLSDHALQLISIKLFTFIIFMVVKQISGKSRKHMSNNIFLMYLCVPFASLGIMMTSFYLVAGAVEVWQKMLMIVFFILMLIGNIMIFYVFDRYSESICQQAEQENLIVQQQAELQYYTRIIEMQEIQKEFQHDISQYLGIIRKMAEENSAGNVKEITEELADIISNHEQSLYSSVPILDYILNEKAIFARQNDVNYDVYVEPNIIITGIHEIELISMMGNLIDNAIQAAAETAENAYVKIRIFMRNKGAFLVLKIENNYEEMRIKKDGRFVSTKREDGLHGLGLRSVERIAKKNHGYLECNAEAKVFHTLLVLPGKI